MKRVICFTPVYQERVWGGDALAHHFGRSLPEGGPWGESWEIVDRDDVQSVVASGAFAGSTLRELLEKAAGEVLGPDYPQGRPFPLLVKWLDCQERLSLQVHPPQEVAPQLGGEPKTENWYIADCQPGAELLAGLRSGVTRESFEEALREQRLEQCVQRLGVKPGDSILVRSGRIHAIDAGNLILEIQQNSDTTYRVYDWGRVGLDGKPRELHIEKSLKSIDFNDFEPRILSTAGESMTIAECPEFRIRTFDFPGGKDQWRPDGDQEPALLHVVRGQVDFDSTEDGAVSLPAGSNVLLPYACDLEARIGPGSVLLVTDRFMEN